MDFKEYQRRARETDEIQNRDMRGLHSVLFGLVKTVGALTHCCSKKLSDPNYSEFENDLARAAGSLLWYLSALLSRMGVCLDRVATTNIARNSARWTDEDDLTDYDQGYPVEQRLPTRFVAEFRCVDHPTEESFLPIVRVFVDGQPFGDPVDDNTMAADGYRFHDPMHFAHAAVLGWSPVVRSLLGRKRKSNEQIDKCEDGARARDTEEALVKMVYEFAKDHSYFVAAKRLDTELLEQVRKQARGLEVSSRTLAQWERAILEAYRIRDELVRHRGGFVIVDLETKTLTFRRDYPAPSATTKMAKSKRQRSPRGVAPRERTVS